MEDRAGSVEPAETLKTEATEHRQAKRKQKIHKIIASKRHLAHQEDQAEQKGQMDLEEEVIKEEVEIKGKLDLCLHHKRTKRKSKKRCWNCKSAGHLRNHCPYIRCFHCQRLGHVKAICHIYRIDKLLKALEKKQKKKEKKKRQKIEKQKKREEELEIPRKRAKQSTFIKKSEEWRLQWNNIEIGTYIEPGEPRPIEEVLKKTFKWTHIEVQIKHPTQIKNLHLEEGFLNVCACQQTNSLRKYEFIKHLYDKHKGVVPPDSQINMPYWIYGVLFDTDDMELLYCRTTYD